ncbi:MAG: tRNA (adenosine(37)-N6)-threonylcarbamoyltransferase complex ATPase subunit type 1 TsaE [Bacteroidales bacterium]
MINANFKIIISELKHLPRAAEDILAVAGSRRIFAFSGPLGSGKTTIIKAICKKLGAVDSVTSPSFTLVNEYLTDSGEPVYHIDLYRIKNISEAYDFGIEEYLYGTSYCFIEWPEIIKELLPENTVRIKISVGPQEERILDFE